MIIQVDATYANGVLTPDTPTPLAEQTRVKLRVEAVQERTPEQPRQALEAYLEWTRQDKIRLSSQRYTRDEIYDRNRSDVE
jgi:predicted DNA-binding antitoxin AbrB/MazE fold protein